jgi:hypothetical protein
MTDQFECAFVTGFRDKTRRICHTSQFFDRLSMHFGVVDHIRASALTTADRRPPSWNRITFVKKKLTQLFTHLFFLLNIQKQHTKSIIYMSSFRM